MAFNRKMKYALLSIISNTSLIIMKAVTGIVTGSVSIISEAIHSGMDLVASVMAFFSVRYSSKPADKDHPYGHGKIENVTGFLEALLIFAASILIIKKAVENIINPSEITITIVAVVVMLISAAINFVVSRILYKVAREEDSVAMEGNALHIMTDVYTSLGVAVGLLLIVITDFYILDSIVAILVALFIIKEAWDLSVKAFRPLLDVRLSNEEEAEVMEIIEHYKDCYIDVHSLRTRKSGPIKHIDFHLTVDSELAVGEAHQTCDMIERALEEEIANTSVTIHIEPYNKEEQSGSLDGTPSNVKEKQ